MNSSSEECPYCNIPPDPPPEIAPQPESENFSRPAPPKPPRRSARVSQTPECLQWQLKDSFNKKDFGAFTYFYGLEVHNVVSESNVKYRCEEGYVLPDQTMFRQLIGILNYLTVSRPDISLVVQQVSLFMQAPPHLHLLVVLRIIQYLLGTSTRGLFFPSGSPILLDAFSDSD
ncbi:uncharacterized mitochondrial protein AtMg00810-like [Solanum lycopersicum]|uniref:uncharacterized mitochondrial protein AtMg00810-like n=1 Tax=Solanum lycopersicum TaxID=4081 RepID=UPI0002BCB3B5